MYKLNYWLINLTLLTTSLISHVGHALPTDMTQDIVIDANTQNVDIKNNVIVFKGDVSIKQGSITIKADMITYFRGDESAPEHIVAMGQPVIYQQIMDNQETLEAKANKIEYKIAQRTLTLTGNASIAQQGSLVSSDKIEYDLNLQKLVAKKQNGESVRTILKPKGAQ